MNNFESIEALLSHSGPFWAILNDSEPLSAILSHSEPLNSSAYTQCFQKSFRIFDVCLRRLECAGGFSRNLELIPVHAYSLDKSAFQRRECFRTLSSHHLCGPTYSPMPLPTRYLQDGTLVLGAAGFNSLSSLCCLSVQCNFHHES